ncbi:MAG: hypothetical protein HQL73_02725 [Magnetococcales bacterium]|nr:hypothetical protein [Magnetococcales bacterium]
MIDCTTGNVFDVAWNANITTLTLSNPPANGKGCFITLRLKQDSTGGRTIAYPASVKWAGGAPPTLVTSVNAITILSFFTVDAGTTWHGNLVGTGYA